MVSWQDPILVLRDYFALTKLHHALASLYIWETVFTFGFELNAIRGKQPYRWTIWIYLGTRYSCLLMWIAFFIHNDSGNQDSHFPCHPLVYANYAFAYASWAFSSLIIVLRIIAIWNRKTIVSSIAVLLWLAGIGLNILTLTMLEGTYNPELGACIILKTHRLLISSIAILVIDSVLLVMMLIGLLRYMHSSTGIWLMLYQQCIIWMVLAAIAEIPPVVLLALNLNDPWNLMFGGAGITILSICSTRMYRSLSEQGSLMKCSSDSLRFSGSPGLPVSNPRRRETRCVHSSLRFARPAETQMSETPGDIPVFIPADRHGDEIPLGFVSEAGSSAATLTVPIKSKSKAVPGYQICWNRPLAG